MDQRSVLVAFNAIKKAEDSERKLKFMQSEMERFAKSFGEIKLPKYSGWFICLAKDDNSPSGYKFLGFFNPDQCDEDGADEPEWEIVIPIWREDSIPEFMGW
jgi:hypothetical protein